MKRFKNVWFSVDTHTGSKILLYQSLGFLAIILLSWLDESLGLSRLIFGNNPIFPEFRASALAMLFVFAVWLLVTASTRRMLERVKYLEGFLKVCAWCRRIDHKGRWMPLEEFLQEGFDTPTSHGICKDCLQIQKQAVDRAKLARKEGTGAEASQPAGN